LFGAGRVYLEGGLYSESGERRMWSCILGQEKQKSVEGPPPEHARSGRQWEGHWSKSWQRLEKAS